MRTTLTILLISIALSSLNAQYQTDTRTTNTNTFKNSIFSGDYPDPSLLVDGDAYYVVHSSFEYYPGLTIWHSKDLTNWSPVTSALTKYVGSVWAPDLVKYNGKYYIYFPADNTNYVIVADSIGGKWSDPINLKISHIDPGHVVDDIGNRNLYFNSGVYVPLSLDGLSVTGELQQAYDGWPIPVEWSIECFCMEEPKLFKRAEYYYMTVAQGGTADPGTGHMVIFFRSESPFGLWENSLSNPIIQTQSNAETWLSVGHVKIFENSSDEWWMIFHGYKNGHYNMRGQTLLAPVEWTNDGWYKISDNRQINKPITKPFGQNAGHKFSLNDSFDEIELKPQWKFFEEYNTRRYALKGNDIEIKSKRNSIAESSLLFCNPSGHSYTAQIEIELEGNALGELVQSYDQKAYSEILADNKIILVNLRGWQFQTDKDLIAGNVFLPLKNINNTVGMYCNTDDVDWIKFENSVEASAYQHNVLSDFLSLSIGLVSMGEGKVRFTNFKYEPIE